MSSTHVSLHYHVVFSTKERRALIEPAWQEQLHRFLGGIIKKAGGMPETIGGTRDHVHLLFGLKPTRRLVDVVREIKAVSSGWARQDLGYPLFSWLTTCQAPRFSGQAAGQPKPWVRSHRRRGPAQRRPEPGRKPRLSNETCVTNPRPHGRLCACATGAGTTGGAV